MKITIEVPDNKINGLLSAFATQYKYKEEIEDDKGEMVASPETLKDFSLNIIKSFISDVYAAGKVKELETQRQEVLATAKLDTKSITVS